MNDTITLRNELINCELEVGRIIGQYDSGEAGPLFIAVGGIHGNEPSGIFAIERVLRNLADQKTKLRGRFVGLSGNLSALADNRRCQGHDLNRCFTRERLDELKQRSPDSPEEEELLAVVKTIEALTGDLDDTVYFVDCHTTSSATIPYISVNEYETSLWLADQLPLYKVIGLEESIPGCFAEFYNREGFHGFTCEAGQHEDLASIEHHEGVIWLLLSYAGLVKQEEVECFRHFHNMFEEYVVEGKKNFHVSCHYRIDDGEDFRMKPGYVNFKRIRKGEVLASNQNGSIRAPSAGRILMPLYQDQGDDGFFIVTKDPPAPKRRGGSRQVQTSPARTPAAVQATLRASVPPAPPSR